MIQLQKLLKSLIQPVIAVIFGLAVGGIIISLTGGSVLQTYTELWNGAFGNFYFFTTTLARATPILLIALGVGFAFRAGVFNLGGEGQMVVGAISAAIVAYYLPAPGIVKLIAAIAAAVVAGGLLSVLAGWMEGAFKIQLVISTLLLNYIAVLFASYLAGHPFQDKTGSAALAQTPMIEQGAWLGKVFQGMPLHIGFIIALVGALLLWTVLRYSVFGYEVNASGKNSLFGAYGGIHQVKVMLLSMFISGSLAGLAGGFEVLGSQYRFVDGALTVPGYAWTGVMAALLANSNPIGIVFTSLLLAALQTGAMGLERNTEIPLEIASIMQAVLILFISAKFTKQWWRAKKKGADIRGAA